MHRGKIWVATLTDCLYCIARNFDMTKIHALKTNLNANNYVQGLCTSVPFICTLVVSTYMCMLHVGPRNVQSDTLIPSYLKYL